MKQLCDRPQTCSPKFMYFLQGVKTGATISKIYRFQIFPMSPKLKNLHYPGGGLKKIMKFFNNSEHRTFFVGDGFTYCQAQLQLSAQLKAELALVPIDPATHPPTHPPAGKVKTSLRNKSNYIPTVSTV